MRKTILLFLAVLVTGLGYAQTGTAKGFNYKGLVTNNGNVLSNAVIGVKIKLKHGSSTKWYEEHTGVHTDANGIFSVNIGEGTKIGGTYANFGLVNWDTYPDMKITVEIDSGTGYHTYVNDIPLKSVPYAKFADMASVATQATNATNATNADHLNPQTDQEIQLITTTGNLYNGFRLSKGSDDWYMYMDNNSDYNINNDGTDVLKISDADNSVWIKGELIKPYGSGNGVKFYSSNANTGYYKFATTTGSLNLMYNGGSATTSTGLKFHGSASVEVMGKLRAPESGDSDMKAYIYGEIDATGNIMGGSSDGFSVTRDSAGVYTITFDTPLSTSHYAVVATSFAAASPEFITFSNNATTSFKLRSWNLSGNPQNTAFQFVVYKK